MFVDLLLVFSVSINLILATYILIKRRRTNYAIPFFTLCLGMTAWALSNYLFQATNSLVHAIFYNKIANASALILSIGIYFFTQTFPQINSKKFKLNYINIVYLILACVFLVLSLFTTYIDSGVIYNDLGLKRVQASFFKIPFYVFIIFSIFSSFFFLNHKYRNSNGITKLQLGVFTVSFIISVIGGIIFNLILPLLGIFEFTVFGPVFTVFTAISSVYCMINYRYTDFRVIFSEVFEKTFLLILFLAGLFFINLIIEIYFNTNKTVAEIILYSILIILFLVLVEFINMYSIKRALFLPDYDQKLRKFSAISINYNSIDKLVKKYTSTLTSLIKVNKLIILFSDQKEYSKYSNLIEPIFVNNVEENIVIYDEENKKLLEGYENNESTVKYLGLLKQELSISVITRLKYLDNAIGYVMLGDKTDGQAFSKYDINFIKGINEIFSVYLYKLKLYLDIKSFNELLQQKIESATAKLQAQKAELQEKYQFEKDMMGIIGHELRTPITIARGINELLLEKIKNNTNIDPAYLKEKLEKIFSSIIKEADLIQTMLSTSHIDNAKVNLQLSQFDLIELIEFAVTTFKKDANAKNLKLSFIRPEKEIPQIINDQSRVLEIVNNLISNAIKYTNEGSVTVSVSEKNGFIEYSVKDTGIGIPKEEIKKIGKKFYRVNQHLDEKKNIVRAGGTGLGLYVVKGLLKAMGGKLKIESEEGVGSTFTAIFPVIVKLKNKESF